MQTVTIRGDVRSVLASIVVNFGSSRRHGWTRRGQKCRECLMLSNSCIFWDFDNFSKFPVRFNTFHGKFLTFSASRLDSVRSEVQEIVDVVKSIHFCFCIFEILRNLDFPTD